jgi:hypothetical protein
MPPTTGATLPTTHRVIDRVHGHTTHLRASAEPAIAARLTDGDVLVLEIPDLAERARTLETHHAHFTRRHPKGGVIALLRHDLSERATFRFSGAMMYRFSPSA